MNLPMTVSVVICTLDRADSLGATLDALRHQRHRDLEVVVVNGPSRDHTAAVLARWDALIRVVDCPVANLSVSRNLGIRAASGEVVAFIDDDALPEFDWLAQALPAFADPEVAAVGGAVLDHTGFAFQHRFTVADRFGNHDLHHPRPADDHCVPGALRYPSLLGTNTLFRRTALERVGGFDETFEYYLDETDVCLRLVDAGFVLRQLPTAVVHHKFLPSHIRDHRRVVTNWFPIVKNQVYFAYRHAPGDVDDPQRAERLGRHAHDVVEHWVADAQLHVDAGRLPADAVDRCRRIAADAAATGARLGAGRASLRLGPVRWTAPASLRFPTVDAPHRRRIVFVTSGYTGNLTGGIARFIADVAPALARRGHEVRVVTRAIDVPTVDLVDGVWVHRVADAAPGAGVAPNTFGHVDAFATAAVREIERFALWAPPDVVYGPLWDVEVLGVVRRTRWPVVVQVATPLAVAAEMGGWNLEDPSLLELLRLEREVLAAGDLLHGNSDAVVSTITSESTSRSGVATDPARWQVVHLGLADHAAATTPLRTDEALVPGRPTALFVGRFERRKGIDTVLEMIARVAPRHPEVRFVLAGADQAIEPGASPCGAQWRQRHRDAEWIDRVDFPGVVDDATLHTLYAAADMVVVPSRYESFGLVMAEAMMHGRPVVSCATSGVREVVRDGVDGVLVAPGDIDALATAVEALLADPARRAVMGAAGRSRFADTLSADRFAERLEVALARVSLHPWDIAVAAGSEHLVEPLPDTTEGRLGRLVLSSRWGATVEIAPGATHDIGPGEVVRVEVDPRRAVVVRCTAGTARVLGVIALVPEAE